MSDEIKNVDPVPRSEGDDYRSDEAVQRVLEAIRGLRFGQVSIIIQDGVVIQIERTERTRLRRSSR